MILLFFLCLFLVIYVYAFFPFLLSLVPERKASQSKRFLPVTIICSAYNEEKVIAQKIRNFYELDYPSAKLLIGLDGCTDATQSIIEQEKKDESVKVFSFSRTGKAGVLNELVKHADTEYIAATDANALFEKNALTELVSHMGKNTGVVCGKLVLQSAGKASGEGIYWQIETAIKKRESGFGLVMGGNGAIYLFRKSLFEPLSVNTINDDFTISMKILQKGYEMVFAENAVAFEKTAESDAHEFSRHVRDSAGHFIALAELLPMLNPFKFRRFALYISHRVLRWFAPFFMLYIHILPFLYLDNPFFMFVALFEAALALTLILYGMKLIRNKIVHAIFYLYLLNASVLIGFVKCISGSQKSAWSTLRQ